MTNVIGNDAQLNEIFHEFGLASNIHSTIHAVQIDLHLAFPSLSPEQRAVRLKLVEYTLTEMARKRDNLLAQALNHYKLYQDAKANPQPSGNSPEV